MPILNNEGLDDPLLFDTLQDWSAGQNSNARSTIILPNQGSLVSNWLIYQPGELRKRRGTRSVAQNYVAGEGNEVQAMIWYDNVSTDRLVAIADGDAYELDGTDTWVSYFAADVTDTTEMVSLVQLTDDLFWTDSNKTGVRKFDGATVSTISPSPVATILETHTNRLVASGVTAIPDAVYFSGILAPDTWDMTNGVIRVGGGTGDPVTAIKSWQDSLLVVLCRQSTYVVDATPTLTVANFVIKKVHNTIGCVSKRSVAQVGQDIWFLSRGGVYSIAKQLATSNNTVAEPVSRPITDVILGVNWNHAHKSSAIFYNNHYLLAVPTGDSTEPDTILAYSFLTGGWSVFTGFSTGVFVEQPFEGKTRLLIGLTSGELRESLDYFGDSVEEDDSYFVDGLGSATLPFTLPADLEGSPPVEAQYISRAMTFSEPINPKSGWYLDLEIRSKRGTIEVNVIRDGGPSENLGTIEIDQGVITLPFTLPVTLPEAIWVRRKFPIANPDTGVWLPPFRELQVEIISTTGGCIVRNIYVCSFLDTLEFS